ncbi:unnamed protein product, partial [Protopolystoma xenopodis]
MKTPDQPTSLNKPPSLPAYVCFIQVVTSAGARGETNTQPTAARTRIPETRGIWTSGRQDSRDQSYPSSPTSRHNNHVFLVVPSVRRLDAPRSVYASPPSLGHLIMLSSRLYAWLHDPDTNQQTCSSPHRPTDNTDNT